LQPAETPISVPVKEDSVKEELSAGKKKKKNKGNLQEKLKLLNDKLNMLNALNKKIESKTGVASSPVLLPLATPAIPAHSSLTLSGTGEDELSDSKKRKTRPNTLYDDYEIDATSRPLKKIVRYRATRHTAYLLLIQIPPNRAWQSEHRLHP
jgi:hypothetical protein